MIHTIVQCVLFFLTLYCYRAWRNRRTWQLLKRLPGPVNFPIIGSVYVLPGTNTTLYFRVLLDLTRTYGSPYCVWLGPMPVVIVSSTEHARIILSSQASMEKASFYRFTPLRGIFSLPVHQWRPHRKVIQPSFKLSILQSFIPVFEQKANVMVKRLAAHVDGTKSFDIYRFTARCTLDMICATTLGTDMHFQEAPTCSYLEYLEQLFHLITIRAANVFLHPDWLYRWTSEYRDERKAFTEFCRPAKDILLTNSCANNNESQSNSLVELLRATMRKDGQPDLEVVEHELNTIIFAGNETSALTVANTLLLLAMYPSVQDKVVAELREHLGDSTENVRYETLQKLVYLEMVLKESMRLFPIALIIGRKTTEEIPLGEYVLPAGVDVFIDIFNIHRNPAYWGADADQFRPERFQALRYDQFAFLAFSAGPRNCIGLRYAVISMKIMLLKVLASYQLETDLKLEDLVMKLELTIKITNGHMVRLKRR